ncbi:hypothetical protein D8B46_02570 [Candidatus Gracilibacteria bacterium]|nr:MAG: hypothetical protein D8B46_02570 [Candidatus Gracilibacteria bacterium]
MKKILKRILFYLTLLLFFLCFAVFLINYYVLSFSKENYFSSVDGLGNKEVGLVFGASVRGGKPSLILQDRLDVAAEAYKSGKINKIIVSGDNSSVDYNEPFIMKKYLINHGVKKEDIYEDFAGFDTYDSLYRAKDIFKADELVLFTQNFHLRRALYIADKLGIKAYGVQTDLRNYAGVRYNYYREILARVKAFFETEIIKAKPKFLGEKIKIVKDDEIEDVKETLKQDIFWENNTGILNENHTGAVDEGTFEQNFQ